MLTGLYHLDICTGLRPNDHLELLAEQGGAAIACSVMLVVNCEDGAACAPYRRGNAQGRHCDVTARYDVPTIGLCNLGIPYYASYSNRSTAVTEIFAAASKMPWGEAQDYIASMSPPGRVLIKQILLSLTSKVQNRGKRHHYVEPTGEADVDVPRPPPALRARSFAGSDVGPGGGGGAQAIAEMAAAAIANMQIVHAASMQQMQATHALSLQQFQRVHHINYRRTSQQHGRTLQQMSQVHSRTLQQSAAAHHAYLAQQQQLAEQQRAQQQRAQQAMFFVYLCMQQRGMYSPYGRPPQMLPSAHTPAIGHNDPPQMLPSAHAHAIHPNAPLQMLPVAHAHAIYPNAPLQMLPVQVAHAQHSHRLAECFGFHTFNVSSHLPVLLMLPLPLMVPYIHYRMLSGARYPVSATRPGRALVGIDTAADQRSIVERARADQRLARAEQPATTAFGAECDAIRAQRRFCAALINAKTLNESLADMKPIEGVNDSRLHVWRKMQRR
ncbi:hypothetical protein JKP88DRAFT_260995 [Tribonema minus]|uniref:Uncharacterized protein n=1 Tax=Tribonema minus TaxID=303371 RepID=A0A835Z6D1_9STRA|nr:hypothetical protein JKP88DRAFT_260995 [Tribonema minus]